MHETGRLGSSIVQQFLSEYARRASAEADILCLSKQYKVPLGVWLPFVAAPESMRWARHWCQNHCQGCDCNCGSVKEFAPGSFCLQIKSSDICIIPKLNASCWNKHGHHTLMYKHASDLNLMRGGRDKYASAGAFSACCANTNCVVDKTYFVCSSCIG